jgi:hypothetical protein
MPLSPMLIPTDIFYWYFTESKIFSAHVIITDVSTNEYTPLAFVGAVHTYRQTMQIPKC